MMGLVANQITNFLERGCVMESGASGSSLSCEAKQPGGRDKTRGCDIDGTEITFCAFHFFECGGFADVVKFAFVGGVKARDHFVLGRFCISSLALMKVAVRNDFVAGVLLFAQPLAERGIGEKMAAMMMVRDDEQRCFCDTDETQIMNDLPAGVEGQRRDVVQRDNEGFFHWS